MRRLRRAAPSRGVKKAGKSIFANYAYALLRSGNPDENALTRSTIGIKSLTALHVETEKQDVAVLDDVLFAFETHVALFFDFGH